MSASVTITLNSEGGIANVDFVQWIKNEIADKVYKRADVAKTYAILISKGHREFAEINAAIIQRWSVSGLLWIKNRAWRTLQ